MRAKKKEKLVLISPSGKEYQIGFLSPCADGFVLGKAQIQQEQSSHLTILKKNGAISAHITPQKSSKQRQYFIPHSIEEYTARIRLMMENKTIFQLSQEQMDEEVFYITVEFEKWYKVVFSTLFWKKETEKEIVYYLDFKRLCNRLPQLIHSLKASLRSFFGVGKARDILTDKSIIAGVVTKSNKLIVPIENELIGIDLAVFTNFKFTPSMDKSELKNPLMEFLQSLGITSYVQQEITEKKYLENLLSKEEWQAASAKVSQKLENEFT